MTAGTNIAFTNLPVAPTRSRSHYRGYTRQEHRPTSSCLDKSGFTAPVNANDGTVGQHAVDCDGWGGNHTDR
jgi:hypothetical protein